MRTPRKAKDATGKFDVRGARPRAFGVIEEFIGPPLGDDSVLEALPRDYAEFLRSTNGCVVFGGGLHIRGCTEVPHWHSLHMVWHGAERLSARYPEVQADDIPFAQDCFGDQFLLRAGIVFRLNGETGETETLGLNWQDFFREAAANPVNFLALELLEQSRKSGNVLRPGQLISVYPPLCTSEAAMGVSMKAVPAFARVRFLATFSAQIARVGNGTKIRISVKN